MSNRDITVSDAVRALKLVKTDLDKHKLLLTQKTTQYDEKCSEIERMEKEIGRKGLGEKLSSELNISSLIMLRFAVID